MTILCIIRRHIETRNNINADEKRALKHKNICGTESVLHSKLWLFTPRRLRPSPSQARQEAASGTASAVAAVPSPKNSHLQLFDPEVDDGELRGICRLRWPFGYAGLVECDGLKVI